jgi:hypothetical protein
LFAALLCASAIAVSPPVQAHALTTTPDAGGAMLIPTYSASTATVIPVQYYWRHHHRYWHHRRYWHGHYR